MLKTESIFGMVVRGFGLFGVLWGLYNCFAGILGMVLQRLNFYYRLDCLVFGLFEIIVGFLLIRFASGITHFCYRGSADDTRV